MKTLLALLTAALVAGLVPVNSEAARMGSGRSIGIQRQMTPPAQRAAPAPHQAQPSQATPATPAQQPAAQASGARRWLGPLAGLAAGLGLGYLLSQGGFGSALMAGLMALVVGLVVFAVIRALARGRSSPSSAPGLARAYGGAEPMQPMREPALPPIGSGSPASPQPVAQVAEVPAAVPPGFDSDGFIKQAKLNFIRLQAANDQRDLDTLKEVTTDEMYAAILADLTPRDTPHHTDVVNLQAQLLEVTTEGDRHWASVRFEGTIREEQHEAAAFQEVWHLQKPVSGNSGWLLAGIQQAA